MKLTLQSDYAMRILMVLGKEPDRVINIDEIAHKFSISKNHLMKVAQALSAGGYITTIRGRNGGIKLAKKMNEIRVGEVICAIEPDMNIVKCFATDTCSLLPACKLKPLVGSGIAAFINVLNEKTLADIC